MTKKLEGYKDNDVELCRTTNSRVGEQTIHILLEAQIPFTKSCRRIPFFLREKYHGADKVWVIFTHPHRYGQARRMLDAMDRVYRERLVLSNY